MSKRRRSSVQAAADRHAPTLAGVFLAGVGAARRQIDEAFLADAFAGRNWPTVQRLTDLAVEALLETLDWPKAQKAEDDDVPSVPEVLTDTMTSGAQAVPVCSPKATRDPIGRIKVIGKVDPERATLIRTIALDEANRMRKSIKRLKSLRVRQLNIVRGRYLGLNGRAAKDGANDTAVALYDWGANRITIASDYHGNDSALLRVGLRHWNVDDSIAGTIRHEIGHYVHRNRMTFQQDDEWRQLYARMGPQAASRLVSTYAGTDERELFAEAWSAYTHRAYNMKLPQLPNEIHQFLVTHYPQVQP